MAKPLVENAADATQVRKARKRARYTRRLQVEDVKAIAETPGGRRFFWRLLEKAGVFTQVPADAPGRVRSFHDGRRSIGLFLLAELSTARPQTVTEMMMHAATGSTTTTETAHAS